MRPGIRPTWRVASSGACFSMNALPIESAVSMWPLSAQSGSNSTETFGTAM